MSEYILGRKMNRFELVVTTLMVATYSAVFGGISVAFLICMANVGNHLSQTGNNIVGGILIAISFVFGVWCGVKWYKRESA